MWQAIESTQSNKLRWSSPPPAWRQGPFNSEGSSHYWQLALCSLLGSQSLRRSRGLHSLCGLRSSQDCDYMHHMFILTAHIWMWGSSTWTDQRTAHGWLEQLFSSWKNSLFYFAL